MKLTLGETLYRLRIARNIAAKQICEGLCDEASLSRARDEARAMDALLFEFIAGRMGATSEEFTLMVTESEYYYLEWQNQVYDAIEAANWVDLEELLKMNIKGKAWINEKLQTQFYHYANAIYLGAVERYAEAYEELKLAREKTILKKSVQEKNTYLNAMELHILILFVFYGAKSQCMDAEKAYSVFHYLDEYIYDGILDINEKARIYPKLVCIGLHHLGESISETEKKELCEKAIHLSRENKTFHDITELLRIYIPLLEKSNSEELAFYKKQYEVFCDLLQSENIDIGFRPEVFGARKPKVYMIHEYLSSKRKEKGFTQEALSDGICEPETYSRVEGGKRAPSRKNFKALAERLDITWALYRGELVCEDFKAYELRRLQRMANIEGDTEKSLSLLDELEGILDMSIVENFQYVKCQEYVIRYRLGEITIEEASEKLKEILFMTQKMDGDISRLVYYSQTEMEIVAHLAQLYRGCGKYEEGIEFIEIIAKQMAHSRLSYEYQWHGFSLLFRVLSSLYFAIGEYDKSIQIAEYVKHNMFKRREGANLPVVFDEIADNLEHKGEQYSEEYKKLYRYTYYVADFYGIQDVVDFAKKYYEEKFNLDMSWY